MKKPDFSFGAKRVKKFFDIIQKITLFYPKTWYFHRKRLSCFGMHRIMICRISGMCIHVYMYIYRIPVFVIPVLGGKTYMSGKWRREKGGKGGGGSNDADLARPPTGIRSLPVVNWSSRRLSSRSIPTRKRKQRSSCIPFLKQTQYQGIDQVQVWIAWKASKRQNVLAYNC